MEIGFFLAEDTMRINLTDCWFNPCDPYVASQSQFSIDLTADDVPSGSWHNLLLKYDPEWVEVSCDGKDVTRLNALAILPAAKGHISVS